MSTVVPVEADKWETPPLGGTARGFIYARGARDMKGVVAVELMVFLLLKPYWGCRLKPANVISWRNADEETGGRLWAAEWWWITIRT